MGGKVKGYPQEMRVQKPVYWLDVGLCLLYLDMGQIFSNRNFRNKTKLKTVAEALVGQQIV